MRYQWARRGDVNAFFGLVLDNLTNLVILAALLTGVLGFSREIVLRRMIPGTALGVLIGDLVYTWLAFRLARQTGRQETTAMPLGIDTPSLFGLAFGVLGPALAVTKDEVAAWQIGMAVLVVMGVLKTAAAFAGPAIRRALPRAALLGPIAGVALLLIAFLPALKVFAMPVVGLMALGVILVTLLASIPLPGHLPGALAAVALGTALYHGMGLLGVTEYPGFYAKPDIILAVPWPTLSFLRGLEQAWAYLPIAIPFALATVIGGIDNTESAAAAGDEYAVRDILLTEGVATLLAGLCGGVIQTTPYIGHPAYKAMGGRAAYTLATALFIGLGGILGYLDFFVDLLPEAALGPILIFIGLQITAQAFLASPPHHAAAVALSFLPVIANLASIQMEELLRGLGLSPEALAGAAQAAYQGVLVLGNGFIFTAFLWAAVLTFLIDRRLLAAAMLAGLSAVAALFGMIHSPFPGGALFFAWSVPSPIPLHIASSYGLLALLFLVLGCLPGAAGSAPELRAGPPGSGGAGHPAPRRQPGRC